MTSLRLVSNFFLLGLSLSVGWPVFDGVLSAQTGNHSYRPFSAVITPGELNRRLGNSEAVQKKIVTDEIQKLVLEKFNSLSNDQQKQLAELAKDYAKADDPYEVARARESLERIISSDPDLKKAADEMRSALREQEFSQNSLDRQIIERGIRDEVQKKLERELIRIQDANPDIGNLNGSPDPGNNPNMNSRDPFPGTQIDPSQYPRNPNSGTPDRNSQEPSDNGSTPNGGFNFDPDPNRRSSNPNQPFSNSNIPEPNASGTPNNNNLPKTPPPRGNGDMPNGGRPDNRPYGGFSDDGSQAGIANLTSPGSASGGNNGVPNESIGHKFNRIVMNSFEKAMERKIGDGATEGQSFNRLLDKFVNSVSKSRPDFASNINLDNSSFLNQMQRGLQRGKNRVRLSGPNWSRLGGGSGFGGGGGGLSMPSFSPRVVLMFLLIVGAIIGLVVFALKKTPLAQYLGFQPSPIANGTPPELPPTIHDYDEVVKLIDRFTLWLFGRNASWWNSKKVQQEVVDANPDFANEIRSMMDIYDEARYADKAQPVSNQSISQIRTTLTRLKDLAIQKRNEQSPLKSPAPYSA